MSLLDKMKNLKAENEKGQSEKSETKAPDTEQLRPRPSYVKSQLKIHILANKKDPDDFPFEKLFLHDGFTHPNFPDAKSSKFRCIGKGCPLCADAKSKEAAGDESAWKLKSKPSFYYYVVDGNDEFTYLNADAKCHEAILDALMKCLAAGTQPLDSAKGRMAVIKKVKNAEGKNEYSCVFQNDPHAVSSEIMERLKNAPELSDLNRVYTQEELEKVLKGVKLELRPAEGAAHSSPVANSNKTGNPTEPKTKAQTEDDEARKKRIQAELDKD